MIRTGIDIVENSRFAKPSERLLEHLFTPYEIERGGRAEYWASRFAAKEACVKALGTGFSGITPRDVEIRSRESGEPYYVLYGRASELLGEREISLSIAHERSHSVAIAVIYEQERLEKT